MAILNVVLTLIRALFQNRPSLALENLPLRQQLAILRQSVKRPKLCRRDRLFWVVLRRYWDGWDASLLLVNRSRPHLSLERNAPLPRNIEPPSQGRVISIPQVGGLHHLYKRVA